MNFFFLELLDRKRLFGGKQLWGDLCPRYCRLARVCEQYLLLAQVLQVIGIVTDSRLLNKRSDLPRSRCSRASSCTFAAILGQYPRGTQYRHHTLVHLQWIVWILSLKFAYCMVPPCGYQLKNIAYRDFDCAIN